MKRERDIEKRLRDGIKGIGGAAYKFVSPGNDGVPDRIVALPGARLVFVELKTEQGALSTRQKAQIRRLTRMGFEVWVLYGEEHVEAFLLEMAGRQFMDGLADGLGIGRKEWSRGLYPAEVAPEGYRHYTERGRSYGFQSV